MKEVNNLKKSIKSISKKFLQDSTKKEILVISHFDTDGITSAAIMIKTLKELDKKFSVRILKSLEEDFIYNLPKDKIILFLDLASASLKQIKESGLEKVYVIDHHEISKDVPDEINIINPELDNKQKISASCLTYLFCKEINPKAKAQAKLAILGMIGDMLDKEIDKLNNGILNEGEIKRKRGLLIYPSTRPLNRTLEFSSNPFIPGVTGNSEGVRDMLRDAELAPSTAAPYKSLIELDEKEMQNLITAVMLRNPKAKHNEIIGDIFLIKLYNKLEDARELSAKINACSRFGRSDLALLLCMEIPDARKKAEAIHAKYKQLLISGLKFANQAQKIEKKGFVIINAQDNIKETMIGTVASILSRSSIYEEGTIITTMAYYENTENQRFSVLKTSKNLKEVSNKIKVSIRAVGKPTQNLREVLSKVIEKTGGQVGGHDCAAGCIITQDKENDFINTLKKNLEVETIKIKQV